MAAVCALTLLLSGCSGTFNKEYRYEEPYEEEYAVMRSDASVQEVKNYIGMRYALLNLVNNASAYGVIHAREYNGTLEEDISRACMEVTRENPMGIYSVDFMTHNIDRIVSYYEIKVYITYKRTPEEIANVVTIHSANEMQELVGKALENFDETLTVMQVSTTVDEELIGNYVNSYYRHNPIHLPEKPEVTVNTYTGSDDMIQKITEVKLEYTHSREELRDRAEKLLLCAEKFSADKMSESADAVFAELMRRAMPLEHGATAYEALLEPQAADSEGYAMAVKLLCSSMGIECHVVEGALNGRTHYWNIVNIDGAHRHVDVFEADRAERDIQYQVDSDILDNYWWDAGAYPVCEVPEELMEVDVSEEESDSPEMESVIPEE